MLRPLFLLLVLFPLAASAHEMEMAPWRTVTVSGEGEMKVAPDKADLSVTLLREAKTAAEAKKETDALIGTLMKIAKDNGIAEKNIRTQYTSLQPQYDYSNNQKPELRGYSASHNVVLTVNDLAKLGPLMEALVKGGIDRIDNISYGVKNEDALKEQALTLALDAAKRKAAMLAKNLGEEIGQPVSITEAGASFTPPPPQPMMMMARAESGAMAGAAPAPPTGEIEIHSQLSASFAFK